MLVLKVFHVRFIRNSRDAGSVYFKEFQKLSVRMTVGFTDFVLNE